MNEIVRACEIEVSGFFRRRGGDTVYIRLTRTTIGNHLKTPADRRVVGVSATGNIAKFPLNDPVVKCTAQDFANCARGIDTTGANEDEVLTSFERDQWKTKAKHAEDSLEDLLARIANVCGRESVTWAEAIEVLKDAAVPFNRNFEEAKVDFDMEPGKVRGFYSPPNPDAYRFVFQMRGHTEEIIFRQPCQLLNSFAGIMERVYARAVEQATSQQQESPAVGTQLRAQEIPIDGYFRSRGQFFVRRQPPARDLATPDSSAKYAIYARDSRGGEHYVGHDVKVYVSSSAEFNGQNRPLEGSQPMVMHGQLVEACEIPIGDSFLVFGEVFTRRPHPEGPSYDNIYVHCVNVDSSKSMNLNKHAHVTPVKWAKSPAAAKFNPQVRGTYRVPSPTGGYHVYVVDGVFLGATCEDSVVEMRAIDQKPNTTGKPLIVPMSILQAADPEPVLV